MHGLDVFGCPSPVAFDGDVSEFETFAFALGYFDGSGHYFLSHEALWAEG